jgi:hypothetical protein
MTQEDKATILPWRPDTRQEQGIVTEKRIIHDRGGVRHPSSGSGKVKQDGHTDGELIEVKDARRSHRISVDELMALYQRGVRQRRCPMYIVHFANGLVLEGVVRVDGKWGA